jgi:methylglutaconyl-CoA hydratase
LLFFVFSFFRVFVIPLFVFSVFSVSLWLVFPTTSEESAMSESLVLYSLRAPAAIITLNREDKRNALSRAVIAALTEAFQRARDDASVRCVILTAAGSVFCAGMDLAELAESLDQASRERQPAEQSPVWDDSLRLATLYDLIYTLPKPTIVAVNGAAIAGGAGLVTVCDLALAVPEARFGYPEVRRGLVAAMVMPHLLRHVGERTARYLLLTGDVIDAAEACRTGLVNAVVPGPQLLEKAHEWARALAEGGPQALARTKEMLHQFSHQAMSVAEAARASAAPRLSEECQQGLRAFFAKQPVPWAPR